MCWNPQNRVCCPETINLRGHMPRFTLKNETFPIYLLGNPINMCWNFRTGLIFLRRSIWGVTCLSLLEKWMFPMYLLRNSISVCWNPQRMACFVKMINFRGHMPMFTLKMHDFPIYLFWNPINICWNLQNRDCFQRRSIWGVTCLGLL